MLLCYSILVNLNFPLGYLTGFILNALTGSCSAYSLACVYWRQRFGSKTHFAPRSHGLHSM